MVVIDIGAEASVALVVPDAAAENKGWLCWVWSRIIRPEKTAGEEWEEARKNDVA